MRRNLIIGIFVSILFHGGLLFGERFIHFKPPPKPPEAPPPTIDVTFVPPAEEEDKHDQQNPEEAEQTEMAPPSLIDMPTSVPVDSFVQQIEPPPPEGLKHNTSAVTIPVFRPVTKGLGPIFNIKDLDQIPQAKFMPNPIYPYELKKQGITGNVTLEFLVDTEGVVHDAYSVKSSHPGFEAAAIQAVSKWLFRPGRKGGKTVTTRMQLPLVFTLADEQ